MKTYNVDIKEHCPGLISALKKTVEDFDPNSSPFKMSPVSLPPTPSQVTLVIPPMTKTKRKITMVVETSIVSKD